MTKYTFCLCEEHSKLMHKSKMIVSRTQSSVLGKLNIVIMSKQWEYHYLVWFSCWWVIYQVFFRLFFTNICFSFASEVPSLRCLCPAFAPAGVEQQTHWLTAWIRFHSGRKIVSFILFFCFCDLKRETVIYSLCSWWFEIEAHNAEKLSMRTERNGLQNIKGSKENVSMK